MTRLNCPRCVAVCDRLSSRHPLCDACEDAVTLTTEERRLLNLLLTNPTLTFTFRAISEGAGFPKVGGRRAIERAGRGLREKLGGDRVIFPWGVGYALEGITEVRA